LKSGSKVSKVSGPGELTLVALSKIPNRSVVFLIVEFLFQFKE